MPTIPTGRLTITPLERDHLVNVLGYHAEACIRAIHADTQAARFLQVSACSLQRDMCKRMINMLKDLTFVSDIAPPDDAGLTHGIELLSLPDRAAGLQNVAVKEPTDYDRLMQAIMVDSDRAGGGMFQSDDASHAAVEAAPPDDPSLTHGVWTTYPADQATALQAGVSVLQSEPVTLSAVEVAPLAEPPLDRAEAVAMPSEALPGDELIEQPGTRGSKRLLPRHR